MDKNGRRTSAAQRGKALDGFFSRPSSAGLRPADNVRRQPAAVQSSRRSIDSFHRTEGFHAPSRRTLQPGAAASPSRSSARRTVETDAVRRPPGRSAVRTQRHGAGKFRSLRKLAFKVTALSVLLVLVTGGVLFGKGYLKMQKVFQGGSSAAALSEKVDPTLLKGEGDGRVNVLLLGAGGAEHNGGDLTDTLMVASIDPVNKQAVLLSIPRDLWAKMPNNYLGNYHKINAAYESGKYGYNGKQVRGNSDRKAVMAGFQGVDGVVERITGIPIHYNALVDFKAFSQAVDTVGGVSVQAAEDLYDPTMAWENGYSPYLARKGQNTFNGKQALNYVRSRQTSSDFARGERQRQVLIALKDKATNLGTLTNPVKLSNLMSAFGDNVQTDISINDMARMATIMKQIPGNSIQSVGLAEPNNSFVTTGNVNGLSVVMPKAGLEDYSQIQSYIRSKLKDGYIAQENANIAILNGTSRPGLASDKAEELKSYGYNVGTIANAPTQDYAETTIYDLKQGSKKYTLNYLKKRLKVQTVKSQLPAGIVAENADIVIILGQNEAADTQN